MTYWDKRAQEIIKDEAMSDTEMSQEIERIVNNMIDDIENEISKFMQDTQTVKVFLSTKQKASGYFRRSIFC